MNKPVSDWFARCWQ